MARKALLLGVDNYAEDELILGAPANDVKLLATTLANIGYAKNKIQVAKSSESPLSTATLRRILKSFLAESEVDDELMIYFSGHGIEQDGHRLWIPFDYYLDDPRPPHELISDSNLYAWSRDAKALSVIFIVDACREGVQLRLAEEKSLSTAAGNAVSADSTPSVAVIYSCERSQVSRAEGGGVSYFTRALCEVLEKNPDCATVSEIVEATNNALAINMHHAGLPIQCGEIDQRPIFGRGGDPKSLIIKEDIAARMRQRIADSAWCAEAKATSLWSNVNLSAGLADQVLVLILNSEFLFLKAEQALPKQRWRNKNLPSRVLRRIETLTRDGASLCDAEAAIALVSPYIYEAILAHGELLLGASGDPLDSLSNDRMPAEKTSWLALRNSIASQEAFGRRKLLLQQQGCDLAAIDLSAWQLQRFLHVTGELWEFTLSEKSGWITDQLREVFTLAPFVSLRNDKKIGRLLSGVRLMRFARAMFDGFEDIELERNRGLDPVLSIGEGKDGWRIDEPALAHLLSLSAAIAIDPRRLSPLLADHLGMGEIFNAELLQNHFAVIEWQEFNNELCLFYDSPHEVLDAVLEDLVSKVESHRARLGRQDALRMLPDRFDARGLKATLDADGRPFYHKPHLRLTQDESRVRELLMGKELYGSPNLALRELYQNALDACRYRRARIIWLRIQGREIDPYVGQIVFHAGYENGRAFIECRENGIGMAERHLQRQFARAGQRFTDSHEFHIEKARWDEAGISFAPNSRFGIGVFSYFMLADEILVETKRLAENGVDHEQGLSAKIVGSGSLFRLRRSEALQVGTTIRLYLNDPTHVHSLFNNILEWLWVPEFDVKIVLVNGSSTLLKAGQPTRGMTEKVGPVHPVEGSEGANGQPRIYWAISPPPSTGNEASRRDVILSDGVFARTNTEALPRVVVNLTDEFRPELSVDRINAVNWHAGYEWAKKLLAENGWKTLINIESVDVSLLSNIAWEHLIPAIRVDENLRKGDASAKRIAFIGNSTSGMGLLSNVGLSEADAWIASVFFSRSTRFFREWQLDLLKHFSMLFARRLFDLMNAGLVLTKLQRKLAEFGGAKVDSVGVGSIRLMLGETSSFINEPMVSALALIRFAARNALSIGEVLSLATPTAQFGLAIPEELGDHDRRFPPTLAELLSRFVVFDLGVVEKISFTNLVLASAKWQRSLQQCFELVAPLSKLGIELPAIPRSLENFVVDARLGIQPLSTNFVRNDFENIFDRKTLSVADLIEIGSMSSMSLGEVFALVSRLAEVGIEMPVTPVSVIEFQSSDHLKNIVALRWGIPHLERQEFNSGVIPRVLVLMAMAEFSLPFTEAKAHLFPLIKLGFRFADFPIEAESYCLDERHRQLLSRDFDGRGPWLYMVPRTNIVTAAVQWNLTIREVLHIAEPLAQIGAILPNISEAMYELIPDEQLLQFLATGDDPLDNDIVTWKKICEYLGQSVTDYDLFLKFIQPLTEIGISVEMPPREALPLLINLYHREPSNRWFSAADLTAFCHRKGVLPEDQISSLKVLGQFGFDVEEAIEFANFCIEPK